jgi:hypothetical protein
MTATTLHPRHHTRFLFDAEAIKSGAPQPDADPPEFLVSDWLADGSAPTDISAAPGSWSARPWNSGGIGPFSRRFERDEIFLAHFPAGRRDRRVAGRVARRETARLSVAANHHDRTGCRRQFCRCIRPPSGSSPTSSEFCVFARRARLGFVLGAE